MAGCAAGTILLIRDLGRPERFLNMLRVFKPSSPLSVGSWLLAGCAGLSSGAALLGGRDGPLRAAGNLLGLGAGAVGLPRSGYTAVLISDTAVPAWQEGRSTLPLLFTASSVGAACSLLELTDLGDEEIAPVRHLGTAAQIAEIIAIKGVELETGRRAERVARPYREGASGALWRACTALMVASLLLDAIAGRRRRGRVAAALLGTAGSIALRVSVWQAGKVSARDPRATFESQRASD